MLSLLYVHVSIKCSYQFSISLVIKLDAPLKGNQNTVFKPFTMSCISLPVTLFIIKDFMHSLFAFYRLKPDNLQNHSTVSLDN